MQHDLSRWRLLLLLSCTLFVSSSCSPVAADAPTGPPATVAQAAAVLDLSKFPLFQETKAPRQRHVAGLTYNAKSDVKQAFAFQRKQLAERGFQELPGSQITDQSASGTFARDGFRVSATTFPASESGEASVMVINHGNVQLDKLPVPSDAKQSYAGPAITMYVTESPVSQTAADCAKLLAAKDWLPYGVAGDTHFFKQNAVRLTVQIAAAPAQGGKTMISYSSELMSAELPAPADVTQLQYSDSTKQLSFDTKSTMAEVAQYYRTELAKTGWQPTTDNLIKSGFKHFMIFRNPAKDLAELEVRPLESGARVTLKYQTAAEVEGMEKRIKEKLEKKP